VKAAVGEEGRGVPGMGWGSLGLPLAQGALVQDCPSSPFLPITFSKEQGQCALPRSGLLEPGAVVRKPDWGWHPSTQDVLCRRSPREMAPRRENEKLWNSLLGGGR
jgi:hypothetical protein